MSTLAPLAEVAATPLSLQLQSIRDIVSSLIHETVDFLFKYVRTSVLNGGISC